MFDFSNYSVELKNYSGSNKLVVVIMKDETAGVAIKMFVELKQKMYSFIVDNSNEHKKVKSVNNSVVGTISHGEHKDNLLNHKCLTYSMNRIQSKNHKIGTYKIDKTFFILFDDKIYILNNGYDGLALGYYS